jgi:hypothetical protein
MGQGKGSLRPYIPVFAWGFLSLAIYFTLRAVLIVRPGITEQFYYPGIHIVSKLFAYLQWMVLPPPDHPYFQRPAYLLSPIALSLWKYLSQISFLVLALALIYVLIKSPKEIKFFVIFTMLTLIPALPLNYKVTSRNIYIPSIGIVIIAGYFYAALKKRLENSFIKKTIFVIIGIYAAVSISAIWTASLEYHRNQSYVKSLIIDLKNSNEDFNKYDYVLLDHLPGRSIVGPAMIYKFGFKRELIASNDPVSGPINIQAAADDIKSKGMTFVVFDYRNGHLIDATPDYMHSNP